MNVKLNDTVLVTTGQYAGKKGKVIATSPKTGKIVVEGVNVHKKAQKARKQGELSQIIEKEGVIDVSNVMVVCDACSLPVRVKYSLDGGKKHRVCPKCGASLDKAYAGKGSAKTEKKEEPKKRVRKRAAKTAESTEVKQDGETPAAE